MFWCCSLETSHPRLLRRSPKVCSVHLCLFFCFAYRVIVTIFLNSIYMCTVMVFIFLAYFTLYNRLQFHPSHSLYVQFSSDTQSCLTCCDTMNLSTPDFPVHHQPPESTETHVHWVSDAIQPSHLLSSPSPPALNLSQHRVLFKWVISLHQVAKVLEFQLQHQSVQWTPRTDLL